MIQASLVLTLISVSCIQVDILSIRYKNNRLTPPKKTTASKHIIKTFERLITSLPAPEQTKVSILSIVKEDLEPTTNFLLSFLSLKFSC